MTHLELEWGFKAPPDPIAVLADISLLPSTNSMDSNGTATVMTTGTARPSRRSDGTSISAASIAAASRSGTERSTFAR